MTYSKGWLNYEEQLALLIGRGMAVNDQPKALEYLKKVYQRDSLLLSEHQSDRIGKTSLYYSQLQKLKENELIIAQQKLKETKY